MLEKQIPLKNKREFKMNNLFKKVETLLKEDRETEAVAYLEEFIKVNIWTLDRVNQIELTAYNIIDFLDESDFKQLLINVSENTEGLTTQEKDDMLLMSKEILKVTMIKRWLERNLEN